MHNLKYKTWKKCMTNRSIVSLNSYKRIRNEIRNATRTILRAEQDSISKQCKSNPKIFGITLKRKLKM